ncbi:DNA translocase FtsK [Thermaerobacter sp. PB12/4term]|uniref:DNA translocase FtsK n=1 Tax=Thermaerobacter sp. PB12/4term TaxID=2293838 RepID=UPI000E32A1F4|nr:DNA translocase FtsK [Thermaerobacter sp. PB12/4term]QIA26991.1 DNA translocase FtsK [Thermaerobacter sp. PB12/4term]
MARRRARRKAASGEAGPLRAEVGGIVLLVAAAATALALAGGPAAGGVVGSQLAAGLRWFLGRAAWVLPPLMAWRALVALLAAPALRARSRQAGLLLAVVLVAVAVAEPCGDLWSTRCYRSGGGLVGTAAGWLLARAFGATGALVAWAALAVLAFRLISGVPLATWAALAGRGLAAVALQVREWAAAAFFSPDGDEPGQAAAVAPGAAAGRMAAAARDPETGTAEARPVEDLAGAAASAPGAGRSRSGTAAAGPAAAPPGDGIRGGRAPWWHPRRWWAGGRAKPSQGDGAVASLPPATGPQGAVAEEPAVLLPGLERLLERAFQDGAGVLEEVSGAGAVPEGAGGAGAGHDGGASDPLPRSGPGEGRLANAGGRDEAGETGPGGGSGGGGGPHQPGAGKAPAGGETGSSAAPEPAGGPSTAPDPVVPQSFRLPPLELLSRGRQGATARRQREILEKAATLQETLASFGVQARIVDVAVGPAVTRFEVEPARGVKVSKIQALASDIALSLAAPDVRIEAPIPGKAAVGIEVPNREIVAVQLRDVLETPEFARSRSKLTVALGQDIAGQPVVTSLDRLVHVLIAGATGSGKSVCINALIASLLFKARPDEVKLLLIDPKVVELSGYNGIPHLIAPVITDARKAAGALQWAVREMERRYELFARTGVRDVTRYNLRAAQEGEEPLPLMVVVIDELADLMMVAPVEVEDAIQRLAQMARAAGIHLVVATQRPSVDVITGVIKANIPSRIAFAVSSQTDSRVILDLAGAEKLVGRGDMLFMPVGATKPVRVQGAYISEKDLEAVLAFLRRQAQPAYDQEVLRAEVQAGDNPATEEDDDLFVQAVRVVLEAGQASVSLIQRRLRVGYTRAGRLIDMMEERGYIGPHQGARPRDVLITWEEFRRRHGDAGLPPGMPAGG